MAPTVEGGTLAVFRARCSVDTPWGVTKYFSGITFFEISNDPFWSSKTSPRKRLLLIRSDQPGAAVQSVSTQGATNEENDI